MRKLIVSNLMSLDGYYEGPGKNVMDLFDYRRKAYETDESFDEYNAERLRAADTLLLGRTSDHIGRGHADIRREACNLATADRYPHVGWIGDCTRSVRNPPLIRNL
jgi:hypothetical protein